MTLSAKSADTINWREIPGYVGRYRISDLGVIASNFFGEWKELRQSTAKGGYKLVSLSRNNVDKKYLVHRLVIQAFAGDIPEGMEVRVEGVGA